MKALSIRQPWPWLIIAGHKDIENRSWRTNYRGPLLVHAARACDASSFGQIEKRHDVRILAHDLQRGGIIGLVDLIDVVTQHRSRWFTGEGFGWVLANPRPVRFVEMPGRLGLFEVGRTPRACRLVGNPG